MTFGTFPTLAAAELRLLSRNLTVLAMATVLPIGLAVLWSLNDTFLGDGGAAAMAASQVVMLLVFTVYLTATMTLAARRQQLYLKRLRSSRASTVAIVAGLSAPLLVVVVAQIGGLFALTGALTGAFPADPLILAVAVALGSVTAVALAFLTSTFTRTPEAAQLTTAPVFVAWLGGLLWVLQTPTDDVGWRHLAVPGAAIAQLTRTGWSGSGSAGGTLGQLAPAVVASAVVALIATLLARRYFRWEPRS